MVDFIPNFILHGASGISPIYNDIKTTTTILYTILKSTLNTMSTDPRIAKNLKNFIPDTMEELKNNPTSPTSIAMGLGALAMAYKALGIGYKGYRSINKKSSQRRPKIDSKEQREKVVSKTIKPTETLKPIKPKATRKARVSRNRQTITIRV